jgi:hypothetical protein
MTTIACQYCNRHNILDDYANGDFNRKTIECKKCDILRIETKGDIAIRWHRSYKDWDYYLWLYPYKDETVLIGFSILAAPIYHYYNENHFRLEFKRCIQNVNPDNCLDKIKLLLVWQ